MWRCLFLYMWTRSSGERRRNRTSLLIVDLLILPPFCSLLAHREFFDITSLCLCWFPLQCVHLTELFVSPQLPSSLWGTSVSERRGVTFCCHLLVLRLLHLQTDEHLHLLFGLLLWKFTTRDMGASKPCNLHFWLCCNFYFRLLLGGSPASRVFLICISAKGWPVFRFVLLSYL